METAELFERTHSEVYNRSGCMYRGLPPRHYTAYESERQKMTLSTANFTVIFNKVQVRTRITILSLANLNYGKLVLEISE